MGHKRKLEYGQNGKQADNSSLYYNHCMATFTYFAYGSNMLLERLQKRCETASFLAVAVVHGNTLTFSKKSKDGSGKATIAKTGNDTALYGALFEIDLNDRPSLDGSEGPGYDRKDEFVVRRVDNDEELTVTTYIAKRDLIEKNLMPYDWYKQLIVAGAWQAKVPDSYLAGLKAIENIPDPCPERTKRTEALAVLKESGWVDA